MAKSQTRSMVRPATTMIEPFDGMLDTLLIARVMNYYDLEINTKKLNQIQGPKSKSLPLLYQKLVGEQFDNHRALADARALVTLLTTCSFRLIMNTESARYGIDLSF